MERNIGRLLTIKDIFNNRLFNIPDYQRGYSWETPQLEDLINDIEQVSCKDYVHYTGTIVLTQKGDRFDIVDGQQRITTLTILLNEIYRTSESQFADIKEIFLEREHEAVLQLNKENNDFFYNTVLGKNETRVADTRSEQNIRNAVDFFRSYLDNDVTKAEKLYQTILTKLGFLCFIADNENEVGCMFEVINNRGKSLSELEKIKNYFIYLATIYQRTDLRNIINSSWGTILRNLNTSGFTSNEKENEFLRNCYLVFYSYNKTRSWHVYEELKLRYPSTSLTIGDDTIEEIKKFVAFLCDASQYTVWFYTDSIPGDKYLKHRKWLTRLRCHHVCASIYPLYLATMTKLSGNSQEVLELLELIEKLNFRVYVLPNANVSRTDSRQGELFEWAHQLYHNTDEPFLEELKQSMVNFIKTHCPAKIFVQSLTIDADESIDYYTWGGLRYLLSSYEEFLRESQRKETWNIANILRKRKDSSNTNDYLSLEHIWARANQSNHFDEGCIEKRRLGNFVLMGMSDNIINQNKDISEKIDKMVENNAALSMLQIYELKKLYTDATEWLKNKRKNKTKNYYREVAQFINDKRECSLINFAIRRWAVPGEQDVSVKIDSFDNNTKEYFTIESEI